MTAMEQTYDDVKQMIFQLAHLHQKHWGGEKDDIIGEANLAFVKAYKTFDPNKGVLFVTYLHKVITNSLRTYERRRRVQLNIIEKGKERSHRRDGFDLRGLLEGLSEDAQLLVKVLCLPPPEVRLQAKGRGFGLESHRSMFCAAKDFLRSLGWGRKRLARVCGEVKAAL